MSGYGNYTNRANLKISRNLFKYVNNMFNNPFFWNWTYDDEKLHSIAHVLEPVVITVNKKTKIKFDNDWFDLGLVQKILFKIKIRRNLMKIKKSQIAIYEQKIIKKIHHEFENDRYRRDFKEKMEWLRENNITDFFIKDAKIEFLNEEDAMAYKIKFI